MQDMIRSALDAIRRHLKPNEVVVYVKIPEETRPEKAQRLLKVYLEAAWGKPTVVAAQALLDHKRETHLSWSKLGIDFPNLTNVLSEYIAEHK